MARNRSSKPQDFFEPWTARQSVLNRTAPSVEGLDAEAATSILEAWAHIDKGADWVLWGSRMTVPGIVRGYLTGKPQVMDDQRIIAIQRWLGLPDGSPTHEAVCKRIAECVNALAGIANPVAFITGVRDLLVLYTAGKNVNDPRTDVRVISLLRMCLPPEDLEQLIS